MNRKSQETCDVAGRFSLLEDVNPATTPANASRRGRRVVGIEGAANMSNAMASFLSSPVRSAKPKIAATTAMQNTLNNVEAFSISPTQTHKYTKPKIIRPNHSAGFVDFGDNAGGGVAGACKKMHREEGQRQARDFDDLMDLIHRTNLDCKQTENDDLFSAAINKPRPLSPMKKEKLSLRLRVPERRSSSSRHAVRRTSQSSSTCTPTTSNSLENNSQEFSCATPSSRPKPSFMEHLTTHAGEKTPKSVTVKRKQRVVTDQQQGPTATETPRRRRSKPKPVPAFGDNGAVYKYSVDGLFRQS